MKRANGTGTVVKLSGNRRKPWMVKVPEYNEDGSFIGQKPLDYFATRPEADLCLAEYNRSQGTYDVDKVQYTFAEVYADFKREKFPTKEEQKQMKETQKKIIGKVGISNMYQLSGSYKRSKKIWNRKYNELRKQDFKLVIDDCKNEVGTSKLNHIMSFFRALDDYALEQGIIQKGYAQFLDFVEEEVEEEKIPYSTEEIKTIWKYEGYYIADILLILLYSCMRIEELLSLETKNIFLDENYMVGGLKTDAGKNRVIPIHHIIKNIIIRYYNSDNKYLFVDEKGNKIKYQNYRPEFNSFMEKLNMEHITHETRLSARSELDRKNANEVCIDRILGHKSQGIGRVKYTQKTIEELIETIELITYNIENNGFRVLSKTM